jgi:hypothetical protein
MKKIFYTLATAALCLTACQKEISEVQPVNPTDNERPTVKVSFDVSVSGTEEATTRALDDHDMGPTPILRNLYIAIFGANGGNLQQLIPAEYADDSGLTNVDGYTNRKKYTAILPLYDEECSIHFIGNFDGDIDKLSFEKEQDFIEKLTSKIVVEEQTEGSITYKRIVHAPGCYWQKVVLENGIKAEWHNGEYTLTEETQNQLKLIALVRNYAKITVSAKESADFTVAKYALINVPYQGTLAPYTTNEKYMNLYTSIGAYCDGTYNTTDNTATNYHNFVDDLLGSGYNGYMGNNDLIFTGNPGETAAIEPSANNGFYMYERTIPKKAGEQLGVIVQLQWKSGKGPARLVEGQTGYPEKYWYKIEVLNSKGEYMPICRNVHYNIALESLDGDGHNTFNEAYNGSFFGNISSSIETATLTDLNNNISRIVVNRMDYLSVNGEDNVDIFFQFYPSVDGPAATSANNYLLTIKSEPGYSQAINSTDAALKASIEQYLPDDTTDPHYGWMHVVVPLKEKPTDGTTIRGKLRVEGVFDSGVGSLWRDIVFSVMPTQKFTSRSEVTSDGNNVTVTIGLPSGLSYSMFPIQVKIESKNNILTTNDETLPVSYGPSYFNTGKNTFYFIRTIQYKDYVDTSTGAYVYHTEIDCPFTNTTTQVPQVRISDMGVEQEDGTIVYYFEPKTLTEE